MTDAIADIAIERLPAGFDRWPELLDAYPALLRLYERRHRPAFLRAAADA